MGFSSAIHHIHRANWSSCCDANAGNDTDTSWTCCGAVTLCCWAGLICFVTLTIKKLYFTKRENQVGYCFLGLLNLCPYCPDPIMIPSLSFAHIFCRKSSTYSSGKMSNSMPSHTVLSLTTPIRCLRLGGSSFYHLFFSCFFCFLQEFYRFFFLTQLLPLSLQDTTPVSDSPHCRRSRRSGWGRSRSAGSPSRW